VDGVRLYRPDVGPHAMSLTLRQRGGIPRRVWDLQATRQLALVATGVIQGRAFDQGRGSNAAPMRPYTPAYARARAKAGLRTSPVNLTRTGTLRRNLRPVQVNFTRALIGFTGRARSYAGFVQKDRPFLAASTKDRALIAKALPAIARQAMLRGGVQ